MYLKTYFQIAYCSVFVAILDDKVFYSKSMKMKTLNYISRNSGVNYHLDDLKFYFENCKKKKIISLIIESLKRTKLFIP